MEYQVKRNHSSIEQNKEFSHLRAIDIVPAVHCVTNSQYVSESVRWRYYEVRGTTGLL